MVKLIQGKAYRFLVEKEMTLPDRSKHFLLTGPDTKKYLIPEKRYAHYKITPGKTITCRIDKINCKGEIFLEPRCPWYTEGRYYDFTVEGIEVRTDNSGINHNVVVVTDKTGSKISVPYIETGLFPLKGAKLKLKIVRISKGKLHLAAIDIKDSASAGKEEYS